MAGSIDKVREKVLQLARDIEKLSMANVPPEQFFAEFLRMVVTAVGARGGAVWLLNGNRLGMIAGLGMEEIGLQENPQAYRLNEKLLIDVLQTGEACTHAADDENDVELPTNHLLVLSALHKEKECVGVVQLFQRPEAPAEARPGYLQFLEQMCGYASRYIEGKHREDESPEAAGKFLTGVEQFCLRLSRSLDTAAIADTGASDGRVLLDCDRLSVVSKSGRKIAVKAVSGQTSVNPRSNLIRSMAALSKRVIAMNDTLTYTGKIDNLPPQIEKPLADFVQESNARMVMVVPLFPSERLVRKESDEGPKKRNKKPRQAFGCMVVENMNESQPSRQLQEQVEIISEHVGASLWNARRHNRIFLRPLWTWIGTTLEWFHGRRIAIGAAILAALGLIAAALFFIPKEYPVEAKGKLMPVTQRAVFSPMQGEIQPPKVRGGDRVEVGQLLLEMKNDEMSAQLDKIRGEIQTKQIEIKSLGTQIIAAEKAESDEPNRRRESLELRTQQMRADSELGSLEKQAANVQNQLNKLQVKAPISGRIPDLKIEQDLMNRPVQAGQLLFHIMDDEGKWQIELKVEGKRIGHIERRLKELRDAGEEEALEVEFIPATEYDKTFKGTIVRSGISPNALADQELGSIYEVIVKPEDVSEIPNLSIRTEVSAKIYCGKRSLGYVMFGDVVEFFQKFFWF